MKFLHLSDLHITSNDVLPNTAGFNNKDTLARLQYIAAHYEKHFLIVTGDIIDNQATSLNVLEFYRARQLLYPFKGRIYLCPGNHDFGVLGNQYDPISAALFDKIIAEPLIDSPTAATPWKFSGDNSVNFGYLSEGSIVVSLYALDTNKETLSPNDLARGEVGTKQLNELNFRWLLRPKFSNEIRIVFFHHHAFMRSFKLELEDAVKLRTALSGKIDVVCFGHRHEQKLYPGLHGVPYWLACGASPTQSHAFEITIEDIGGLLRLNVKEVPII